jgi:protein dithiol:quinone oxidoreductase
MAFGRRGRGASAPVFTLVFMVCIGLLGYGLVVQHWGGIKPCPWCIVQRLVYMAIASVALMAALHRPGPAGTGVYSLFGGIAAAGGVAAAAYQVYIERDPQRALGCTGSSVENFLDQIKVGKAIPPLLQYEGACTPQPWSFLGLSIPEWSLVCFVLLMLAFIAAPFLYRK